MNNHGSKSTYYTSSSEYGAHTNDKNATRSSIGFGNDSPSFSTLRRLSTIVTPKHQGILSSLIMSTDINSPHQSKFKSEIQSSIIGNGLANIGQTCYMNSVLQCLFHVAEGKLMDQIEDQLQSSETFKETHELLFLLSVTRNICVNQIANYEQMCSVKDIVDVFATNFRGTSQQCAHEFFCKIRELIHECLNTKNLSKSKIQQTLSNSTSAGSPQDKCLQKWNQVHSIESSLISDYFRGQFLKLMTCKKCYNQVVLSDVFDDLQLHIPTHERRMSYSNIYSSTIAQTDQLKDYLRFEFRKEILAEATCEKCKNKGMELESNLIKIPKILVAQIVRFDAQNNKKHNKILLPSRLDISELIYLPERQKFKNTQYKLNSIIDHHGETLFSGHYTASIFSKQDNNWYLFNDDQVSKQENSYASKLEQNGSSTAYILFYEQIQN